MSFLVNLAMRSAGALPTRASPRTPLTFLPAATRPPAETRTPRDAPAWTERSPSTRSERPEEARQQSPSKSETGSPVALEQPDEKQTSPANPLAPPIRLEKTRTELSGEGRSLPENVTVESVEPASSDEAVGSVRSGPSEESGGEEPRADAGTEERSATLRAKSSEAPTPRPDAPFKARGEEATDQEPLTEGTERGRPRSSEPSTEEAMEDQERRTDSPEASTTREDFVRADSEASEEALPPDDVARSSAQLVDEAEERAPRRFTAPVESAPQAPLDPKSRSQEAPLSPGAEDDRAEESQVEESQVGRAGRPRAWPSPDRSSGSRSPVPEPTKADSRSPSVEVHIGTIEVRASEPDASQVQRSSQSNQRTEPKGFEAYAAERRYEK